MPWHPEQLLIPDPGLYAVTHAVGAKKTAQMVIQKKTPALLLLHPPSSVHITGGVAAATRNLSQPLRGILTVVHRQILHSWAKTIGEALYEIICDSCGAREGYSPIDRRSNEGYLPGVGV